MYSPEDFKTPSPEDRLKDNKRDIENKLHLNRIATPWISSGIGFISAIIAYSASESFAASALAGFVSGSATWLILNKSAKLLEKEAKKMNEKNPPSNRL